MTKHSSVTGDATDNDSITEVWKAYCDNIYSHYSYSADMTNNVVNAANFLNNDYVITNDDVRYAVNNLWS